MQFAKSTLPTPAPVLCLTLAFELPTAAARRAYAELSDAGATRAVREACARSGWFAEDRCGARARHVEASSSSFEDLHCEEQGDGGSAERRRFMFTSTGGARYEFVVAAGGPARGGLVLRVFADLPSTDGVLATRIGLFAMQIVEGGSREAAVPAARALNPPLHWTLAHSLNFVLMILVSLARLMYFHALWSIGGPRLLAWMDGGGGAEGRKVILNSGYQLYALAACARPRTRYFTFTWKNDDDGAASPRRTAYRRFLALVDEWVRAVGLRGGYFYLNNFSPRAAPGLARDVEALLTRATREAGIFDRPDAPPTTAAIWALQNCLIADKAFVNNYGRHSFAFDAVPTRFVWDWSGLAPVHGAGMITVNGVSMAWIRGTADSVDVGHEIMVRGGLGEGGGMYQLLIDN